jgi:glutamyl-tRNA synthetase
MRLRFAPSPTGYLHVGGARTALFNWLLARRRGGAFVLRIEDTDLERSSTEMVDGILEGMRWLGLDWDEGPDVGGPHGPYFQAARADHHRKMAADLVAGGRAYYCYCTPEDLQAKRQAGEKTGGGWRYDRTCAALTPDEVAAREREGRPRAVRFRVPPGAREFQDLVHGPITFDLAHVEDFVILRSGGHPTYQLSVVSDDIEMGITHVIRGDDHISNTPKQILLYEAMGAPVPAFAHVPLILGTDKKRLSKRHGATSVMDYARRGYLPEAMVNFLALLGWSPGTDQEIFTREELITAFEVGSISTGDAVFNPDKLDWVNQQHLFRLSPDDLAARVKPLLEAEGLWNDAYLAERRDWFYAVLELLKPRARTLVEFTSVGRFFFTDAIEYDQTAVKKHVGAAGMPDLLTNLNARLAALPVFDIPSTEQAVRGFAEEKGVKAPAVMQALRVAVTGKTASPGLFEVLALVGRDRTVARVRDAVARAT